MLSRNSLDTGRWRNYILCLPHLRNLIYNTPRPQRNETCTAYYVCALSDGTFLNPRPVPASVFSGGRRQRERAAAGVWFLSCFCSRLLMLLLCKHHHTSCLCQKSHPRESATRQKKTVKTTNSQWEGGAHANYEAFTWRMQCSLGWREVFVHNVFYRSRFGRLIHVNVFCY